MGIFKTFKAYTDIEQSKKLAEILPIDTADMWWSKNFIYYNPTAAIGISAEYSNVYTYKFGEDDIPCWSLAALIGLLPNGTVLSKSVSGRYFIECLLYDNLIDACVEMIVKLKEKDLL